MTIGAVNHFLLSYALQTEGLTDADVELVNMAPELTGSTFMTGQVDAAVTWEPFLNEAQSNGGTLLYSAADAPGVVVDVLMTSKKFAEANETALKSMVAAIDRGVEDFKAEKEGTDDIVAGMIGSKPEEVRDIAAPFRGDFLCSGGGRSGGPRLLSEVISFAQRGRGVGVHGSFPR